ncbi:hypothetical protein RND71_010572 [Anisodus tanguticus]|uniref:F-box domain-containing protein n=1 Tax=Anisodus tanguticus TaxID=243964 RepID=A0AAE1SJT1_9SOLA|nr:hypothetical protein RND71_010572 [Anisodus tanguticus]
MNPTKGFHCRSGKQFCRLWMRDETAKIVSCALPGDVIVEILLRLPFKSLLRFLAVSKPWYGFLSSRDFIQMHLCHCQLHNEKLLRVSDRGPRDTPTISFISLEKTTPVKVDEEIDDGVEVYKIGDFDDADLCSISVDLPFPSSPDDEVWIVGSCNGLLCVHFNRSSSIILWNPATRKYRFLECPDCVSFYSDPFFPYIMLGFVPETDDYKVVKVPSSSRKDSNAKRECSAISYKTESSSATKMTVNSGIRRILPNSDICGFEFDPCGYSMNSIEGAALFTIHVTPEDGFSYASFEAVGYYLKQTSLVSLVERCWHVSSQTSFLLLCMRMLLASYCKHICSLDVKGYSLAEWIPEEFGKGGFIVYQKFTRTSICRSPKSILKGCWKEEEKE